MSIIIKRTDNIVVVKDTKRETVASGDSSVQANLLYEIMHSLDKMNERFESAERRHLNADA